jgi:bacterial/archaeal transporter family-2 protein
MNILYYVLAIIAGVTISVQSGTNSQLRLALGKPILVTFISFFIGTIVTLAILISTGGLKAFQPLGDWNRVPWWKWMGGLLSATGITCVILSTPKLSATGLTVLLIAGQIISATVLDHYGLVGFEMKSISFARIVGVLLLATGVLLVLKT